MSATRICSSSTISIRRAAGSPSQVCDGGDFPFTVSESIALQGYSWMLLICLLRQTISNRGLLVVFPFAGAYLGLVVERNLAPHQSEEHSMKRNLMTIAGVVLMCVCALPVFAQSPVQLSLFSPIQIVPENQSIAGVRLSLLYGSNANMKGLDWGFVTKTSGNFTGVQWGFVGLVDGNGLGWQSNLVSITNGAFEGLQWGFYNSANRMNGLQLGFINSAGSMKGIQLGLLNFIKSGGFMPFFPFVNWSF
jgi:hypothetical protein